MQDDVANYSCHLVDSKNNNSLIAKNKFVVVGKYFFKFEFTVCARGISTQVT